MYKEKDLDMIISGNLEVSEHWLEVKNRTIRMLGINCDVNYKELIRKICNGYMPLIKYCAEVCVELLIYNRH